MFNNYLIGILRQVFSRVSLFVTLSRYPAVEINKHYIHRLEQIFFVLKYSSIFRVNTLVELTVSDNPKNPERFLLHAFLLSVEYNFRLALNCSFNMFNFVPTLSLVYPNSCWSEREIRDMFGIYFTNNPDLRRLLTDYGFEGFPLRKDFPLTGFYEVRYDDEFQQILYEPVQLAQEFRLFSLSSPWEKKIA